MCDIDDKANPTGFRREGSVMGTKARKLVNSRTPQNSRKETTGDELVKYIITTIGTLHGDRHLTQVWVKNIRQDGNR